MEDSPEPLHDRARTRIARLRGHRPNAAHGAGRSRSSSSAGKRAPSAPSVDRRTMAPLHQPIRTTRILPAIRTSTPPAPTPTIKARPRRWVRGLLQLDREVELWQTRTQIGTARTAMWKCPGDTNSADIVGRTGEQMPLQSHDGLEAETRERRPRERRGPGSGARRSARSHRAVRP